MLLGRRQPQEVSDIYKCTLVPLDGSTLAEQALPHATALAERFQAELILLRVLIPSPRAPTLTEAARKKAEEATAVFPANIWSASRPLCKNVTSADRW